MFATSVAKSDFRSTGFCCFWLSFTSVFQNRGNARVAQSKELEAVNIKLISLACRPLFFLLFMLCSVIFLSSQSPVFTFHLHDNEASRFGCSVSNAGDVDRDGYPDFIVGAFMFYRSGEIGMARVFSGTNGRTLYSFYGYMKQEWFGISVAGAGDVDRDGHADVIVGAHGNDSNGVDCGAAYVYSGKDGRRIHSFFGVTSGDLLGYSVAGVGDVNRDGFADVIVGAPLSVTRNQRGFVRVFSGMDGKILYSLNGPEKNDSFGHSVSGAGDVNRDGYPDFIVGASGSDSSTRIATAHVFSGIDGTILYTFRGDSMNDRFGESVSGAGDVNRDGYADLVVGARMGGFARVFSGQDGKPLLTLTPGYSASMFGCSVSQAGDVNGDGCSDVIVGAYNDDKNANRAGSAHVFSGKDSTILFRVHGDKERDQLGVSVSDLGDFNRDGDPDVVVGAWRDSGGSFPCFVRVVSSRPLAFSADTNALSLARGGKQILSLDAGVAHAQKAYLVLGSLTGTSPGIQVGAVTLPLNPDPYMLFTIEHPNTLVQESLGVLELYGRGVACFHLPAGLPPSLVGAVVHHAFVAAQVAPFSIDYASNPVLLRLEP
jgi:FG-GAP repeat protein